MIINRSYPTMPQRPASSGGYPTPDPAHNPLDAYLVAVEPAYQLALMGKPTGQ